MRSTALRQLRFQRGLLQLVVAKRAEIAYSRLSAIENGTVEPHPEELCRLAAALGVSLERVSGAAVRPAPGS
ncbi:MAG: helix-turn-helix transcriptional regulator [Candidatus Binatia bacterium]